MHSKSFNLKVWKYLSNFFFNFKCGFLFIIWFDPKTCPKLILSLSETLPRHREKSPRIRDVIHRGFTVAFRQVDKVISSSKITVPDLFVTLRCMRMPIRNEIVVLVLWWILQADNLWKFKVIDFLHKSCATHDQEWNCGYEIIH